jgi:hypothetical protein
LNRLLADQITIGTKHEHAHTKWIYNVNVSILPTEDCTYHLVFAWPTTAAADVAEETPTPVEEFDLVRGADIHDK